MTETTLKTSEAPTLRLKIDEARKNGEYSTGAIRYQLLCDADHQTLSVQLLDNLGGSGVFSKEIVPWTKVLACIEACDPTVPVRAKQFRPAFKGGSNNNAGFLCAVLRHEELLLATAVSPFQHLIHGDWMAWAQVQLQQPGEALTEPPTEPSHASTRRTSPTPQPDQPASRKRGRPGKTLGQPILTPPPEPADASAA